MVQVMKGADVVHAHGLDGLTDMAVHSRYVHGAAVGVSTHGGYFHTERMAWLKHVWLRTVTRATLSAAGAVWYTSEADQDVLSGANVRGSVMPNGVDIRRFEAVERAPQPGVWLVPGRIDSHKGHADLFAALERLGADDRPLSVRIVGPCRDSTLLASLRQCVSDKGLGQIVQFLGAVSDNALDHELAAAELALFPSRHEGFGVGVVEAMAASVPVAVSAIPPFEELVQHGVSGWRVDFRDPSAAAAGLAKLGRHDLPRLVSGAATTVAGYSWPVIASVWDHAYEQLLRTA